MENLRNEGKRGQRSEKRKRESIFSKAGKWFKESSVKSRRATVILFIMILLSVITGIVGSYLFNPAKEMYVAESTFHKESRAIYDYKIDSEERATQQAKADEASQVYSSVMDKYTTDSNNLIAWYASIHSLFFKICMALGLALPFVAIVLMFIGSPKHFIFAIINMVLVVPVTAIVFLFRSFKEEKSEKKNTSTSKKLELKEA